MSNGYEVAIVNPPRRRRRRKAAPRRKPTRRRTAARRSNPGMMELQGNRWVPVGRPRRRRNPSIGGLSFGWSEAIMGSAGRLLGKVLSAWAVRQFGNPETDQISGGVSPTTGQRWTFLNHVICLAAGAAAAAIVGKKAPRLAARIFEGSVDLSVTKAFWSEIIHRTASGPKYLGSAEEGSVLEDGRGGTYIRQGGKWVAMMGLEAESNMDGLEYANSLGRRPARRRALGMTRPPAPGDGTAWQTGGNTNPYLRAFQA